MARSADTLPEHRNLTTVAGSLYDPAVSARATEGADVIVVAPRAAPSVEGRLIDHLPDLLPSAAEARAGLGLVGGAGSLRVTPEGPLLVEWADFPDEASEEAPSHRDGPEALLGHRLVLRQRGRPVRLVPPGPADRADRVGGDVLLTDAGGRSELSAPEPAIAFADAGGRSELSAPEPAIAFADEIERPVHHRERFTVAY